MKISIKRHEQLISKDDQFCGWDRTWEDFLNALPKDDCRWGLFAWETKLSPTPLNLFVSWSPDTARVRNKMIYTSSKQDLKRHFTIFAEFGATCAEELCDMEERIASRVIKHN
jgi:hypothetical protein